MYKAGGGDLLANDRRFVFEFLKAAGSLLRFPLAFSHQGPSRLHTKKPTQCFSHYH
jgi:hypothetical protein